MSAALDRRQFLRAAAAGSAAVVLSSAFGAPSARAAGGLRVYVLVVDGCRPDEITPTLTPRLHALKSAGTWFAGARSLPVMETIPNHVMMMTGVRPDRSGVPANAVYDRVEGVVRDLDRPTDLHFPTLLERLRDTGRTTGSVLSKQYLFGIFGTRATYRWEPFPLVPVSGHAPDAATMDALLAMVDGPDPDLVFANLGDIDRVGHSDLSGTSLRAARTGALASTDLQVGRFVDHLRGAGKWETSVVLVLADHSMDWSVPTDLISVDSILTPRPDLRSSIQIAQNGGADLLYWTGAEVDRSAGSGRRAAAGGRAPRRPVRARPRGAAARPGGRRPGRLLQGGLAVHRPDAAVQPDPRQPRAPGDGADPVPRLRRTSLGAPRRGVRGSRPHRGRRPDGGRAVRAARAVGWLRRNRPDDGVPARCR